jgi:hypothetical protein
MNAREKKEMRRVDVGKALGFPFEDKDWIVKMLIGGILLLIPIVNFIVLGYSFKVLQKTAREGVYEFPAWGDWGSLFGQGFFVFLMGLFYFLVPAILCAIGGVLVGGSILAGVGHSYGALPLAGLGILFLVLGGIIGFVISLFVPMAMTVYADTGEFGQAFNFGVIFSRISSNAGNYLLAILIYIGLAIVLGIVRRIPFLGLIIDIFAGFYAAVVMSYLFGFVYRGNVSLDTPAAPTM